MFSIVYDKSLKLAKLFHNTDAKKKGTFSFQKEKKVLGKIKNK